MRCGGVLAGFAGALLLAACGGSSPAGTKTGSAPTAAAVLAAALGRAHGAKTAHLSFQLRVTSGATTLTGTSGGDVDLTGGNADLRFSLSRSQGGGRLIAVGTTTYLMATGPIGSSLRRAVPTPWASLPSGNLIGGPFTFGSDVIVQLGQLSELTGVTTKAPTAVDGVMARHYTGSIDLAAALARRSPPLAANTAAAKVVLSPRAQVDVYVGPDGVPRRIVTSAVDLVAGHSVTLRTTYDLTALGTSVAITAPPATQVTSDPTFGRAFGTG